MTKLDFLTACCCLIVTTLFSQKPEFSTLLIPSELKEDANSVVRFESVDIEMTSQKEMTVKIKKAITILNKHADGFADIKIQYDRRRVVKKVSGSVYDAMGNQIEKIRKSDFNDYSVYDGFSLYNDGRFLKYDYTPTTYPYTIYYEYEIKTSNTVYVWPWYAIQSYYQSVQESKYTFNYPPNVSIRNNEYSFDGYNIIAEKSSGKISYQANNLSAIEWEPNGPSFNKITPNIRVGVNKFNLEGVNGEANNWDEFGKWYYNNLLIDTFELPERTKTEIRKLTYSVQDPIEKAKIVYDYVQNKVRYINISVGIGGFKPMLASEVDNLSYGDCKALTNYTKALLTAVDVPSNYTVIYGDSEIRDINPEFLSIEGNHIILNIPNGEENIWLECTSQDRPFGEIAGFTDNRDALIITQQGGKIVHTRVYDAKENSQSIKGNYSIESNGNIEAEVAVVYRGSQFDNHLGIETSNNKDKEKLFKEFWDNINNITLNSIDVKNNKKEGQFEESISFTATNYGTVSGNRMIIPLNAFNVIGRAPKRVRNRRLPVDIPRGFYDTDEVTIKLPSDYTIEAIADDVNVETKYGTYTMTVEKIDEHNLKFTRKFLLKAGEYPKEEYDAYRNFWRKVVKGDKSKIVLVKK